jgi:hypothetical protein
VIAPISTHKWVRCAPVVGSKISTGDAEWPERQIISLCWGSVLGPHIGHDPRLIDAPDVPILISTANQLNTSGCGVHLP